MGRGMLSSYYWWLLDWLHLRDLILRCWGCIATVAGLTANESLLIQFSVRRGVTASVSNIVQCYPARGHFLCL
jgi:hypothetical protein